ncbi:uncharacterized protein [Henckelia pumila]|uniref:uncharacterized protein n=1 Tax=Henckelia pumila TaxID=405737 RepID=UPI003C6DCA88
MDELIDENLYDKLQAEDGDFDCVGSEDEFASNNGSDDENTTKYPMHNPRTDGKNPELKVVLIFSSKDEAKFSIESHCLRRGMMVKFVKNDRIRLRVVLEMKGVIGLCMYRRCRMIIHGRSKAVAYCIINVLGMCEVCKTMKADVTKSQAYRARKKAKQLIDGKMEEQFNKIWDYCEEIQRTNPGSTVIMKLLDEEGSQQKRFHRFYMCLNACKLGFKNSCRRIIGVDGCFLKGRYGGQLLTAVGVDPNNQIFPIAYAIVESETKDSWLWFLKLLDGDIGFENDHKWTFISDKQKGLIPAFESFLPDAENRFCQNQM